MAVIVVAATKGGVAKTTLSACLAVSALQNGYELTLVDLDRHVDGLGSLSRWHQLREQHGGALPALQPALKYPDEEIQAAINTGADYVIVDTPPGNIRRTTEAIEVADLIVVPCRPSPIDALSMDAIVDAALVFKKPFVFVISVSKPNSKMSAGARQYLSQYGEVLAGEVSDRVAYASGFLKGLVGQEVSKDKQIRSEMNALWREVARRAKPSTRTTKEIAGE